MPFMDAPPGSMVSGAASGAYGGIIRRLRKITERKLDKEPTWRSKGTELTTGYQKAW
jgi:hydrogenase small subunit